MAYPEFRVKGYGQIRADPSATWPLRTWPMTIADCVDAYGRAIEENRAAIVVGAGLSLAAGYPNWDNLLSQFRADLGLSADFADLPMLAQFVENTAGGRDNLANAVTDTIAKVTPNPSENHRLIAQLPVKEIWTTNYDTLLEATMPKCAVIERDDDLVTARADRTRIYKMHGSIHPGSSAPAGGITNLVLSRDDFDRYHQTHPRFWALLQAQFLTTTFLFVGYSLQDPNFQSVLRLVRTTTPDIHVTHFAILKQTPGDVAFQYLSDDLKHAGVTVVPIAEHSEIPELLKRLIARSRPNRLYISGSPPTTPHTATVDPNAPYPAALNLEPALDQLATNLGKALASASIQVMTGSLLGATVGYALLESLGTDYYDPDRLLVIRRHNQEQLGTPPNRRSGTMIFIGTDPAELRDAAFNQVRATLVIGGGDGTLNEVERAREQKMGIVPLAHSGGTALKVWEQMSSSLTNHVLGGRSIDPSTFKSLNDPDPTTAVNAAISLIAQAMYLPTPTP